MPSPWTYFDVLAPKIKSRLHTYDHTLPASLFTRSEKKAYPLRLVQVLTVPARPSEAKNVRIRKKKFTEKSPDTIDKGIDCTTSDATTQILLGTAQHKPKFSDLPIELHDLVFCRLEFDDIVHLALTSQYFWDAAQTHIRNHHMSYLGAWAGQNIVAMGLDGIIGDYHYPKELFTEEERKELSQFKGEDGEPMPLWEIALYHYDTCDPDDLRKVYKDLLPSKHTDRIMRSCSERFRENPIDACHWNDVWYKIQCAHSINLWQFCPTDQAWMLRNLTTKQFVRSEEIALRPEFINGPDIKVIGFGHVVLSRICWSQDPENGMDFYDGEINRGVWAGHRFDITTVESHRKSTKGEVWEDVSQEIATELATIFASKFGPDWHRIVVKRYFQQQEQRKARGTARSTGDETDEEIDKAFHDAIINLIMAEQDDDDGTDSEDLAEEVH